MLFVFTISLALSSALIVLNSFLGKKTPTDREKPSPFECGFDPKSHARLPFSLRFYLIAVVFLIFDVEITLIVPLPLIVLLSDLNSIISLAALFILILLAGLYHEWTHGALNWK